jgi:hypothetical protein
MEYRTLEQDIFEIFSKRNIEVLCETVHFDKKKKCFVWTIEGRSKK